jgi:hypothetical protein
VASGDATRTRAAQAGKSQGGVYYVPVLCTALVLRVLLAIAVVKGDPRLWFFNQASEYGCLAQSMLAGHGYASPFCGSTGPSAFLAPGYPALVALAFRIFGAYSVQAAAALITLQIVFGLLSVLALMLLAERLLGRSSANVAGLICAVSPPMMWLPVLFWETSLSLLLLLGLLLAALHCVNRPRWQNWIALGIYCALAMFVNPSLLLTFAGVLVWTAWQMHGASRRGPVLAALAWCIVFSIWPIRNAYRLHAFVPLRTNLGYELWQGNRPGSDGSFSPELHPNASMDEYKRYARIGEVAYMREKSQLAMATIEAGKMRFLRLSLRRFAQFWLNLDRHGSSVILTANIACTSLMSLVGLVLLIRRRATIGYLLAIPFVVLPAPYYLTHADFRFRLLLDPLALLLTTFVLRECWRLVRRNIGGENANLEAGRPKAYPRN